MLPAFRLAGVGYRLQRVPNTDRTVIACRCNFPAKHRAIQPRSAGGCGRSSMLGVRLGILERSVGWRAVRGCCHPWMGRDSPAWVETVALVVGERYVLLTPCGNELSFAQASAMCSVGVGSF